MFPTRHHRKSYQLVPLPPPISVSKFMRNHAHELQQLSELTRTQFRIDTHDPALPLIVVTEDPSSSFSSSSSSNDDDDALSERLEAASRQFATYVDRVRAELIQSRRKYEGYSKHRAAYVAEFYRRNGLFFGTGYPNSLQDNVKKYRAGEMGSFSSGSRSFPGSSDGGYH